MKGKIRHLWLFPLAADLAAVAAAYYTAFLVRCRSEWGAELFSFVTRRLGLRDTGDLGESLELFYLLNAPRIILLIFGSVVILYALGDLYSGRRFLRRRPVGWVVTSCNLMALGLFYTYFYFSRNVFHPRTFFALVMFLNVIYTVLLRGWMERGLDRWRRGTGVDRVDALLLGEGAEAEYLFWLVEELRPHGLRVGLRRRLDPQQPLDGQLAEMVVAARERGIGMIIAAEPWLTAGQIMRLLEAADGLRIPVKVLSDQLDVLLTQARLPVDLIRGVPLVHFDAPDVMGKQRLAARLVARLLGVLLILPALPVMAVAAALVRLTSPGPVFFVQERIGVNRRPFLMFKFRTMYDRADEARAEVEEFREGAGPLFKLRRDPRVTPVGRFLRRFSLDELPQLWNVVRGDMVLVGPRPLPREDFEGYYEEWHYSRHSGMPGLTCLWQVSGRSDLDFHNMCILDVYYLRNRSWILDLKILLRTGWAVVFARGAY